MAWNFSIEMIYFDRLSLGNISTVKLIYPQTPSDCCEARKTDCLSILELSDEATLSTKLTS